MGLSSWDHTRRIHFTYAHRSALDFWELQKHTTTRILQRQRAIFMIATGQGYVYYNILSLCCITSLILILLVVWIGVYQWI